MSLMQKSCRKDTLYGSLDTITREWTDGLFTSILRRILDNLRGEAAKRHWIIFDGDVDPVWVENLNSVLDDNRLLTLPNGERLVLPLNVRIMFEGRLLVIRDAGDDQSLRHARIYVDSGQKHLPGLTTILRVKRRNFVLAAHYGRCSGTTADTHEDNRAGALYAQPLTHIMSFSTTRALQTFFSMLDQACRTILRYNLQHAEFPLEQSQVDEYLSKKLLLAIVWAMAGDAPLTQRHSFANQIIALSTVSSPSVGSESSIFDYEVTLPLAEWSLWQKHVPRVDVPVDAVTQTDLVIPTLDTGPT
ncbi:hypothetical protein MRB53_038232 [Persea americana]|nr:hypothetical protein MRB53_038232 [Persea americana]